MKKKVFSIPVFIIFWLITCSALASDFYVQTPVTASSIRNACQTAFNNVATGPHNVIIPDGIYSNLGTITIDASWDGQSGKKLALKAETSGGVTFSGNNKFVIIGDYWVLKGLTLTGYNGGDFSKNVTVEGDNVRITDCYFHDISSNTNMIYAIFVEDHADNVEIDHNKFETFIARGIFVYNTSGDVALNPHIHHNYFKDFSAASDGRGRNAVYLNGVMNTSSDNEMNAIVEYNLFDNCHGSGEQLLVKCSNNTIRYNVLKNSYHISLRHGDDNLVFNNWIFGEAGYDSQFLQVSGAGHRIINNYVKGTRGAPRCINIMGGGTNYEPVTDLLIEGNRFAYILNSRLIQISSVSGYYQGPVFTLRSNVFHADGGKYIGRDYLSGDCTATWTDNIVYTTGTYYYGTGCRGSWPSDNSNANKLTSNEFSNLWTERINTEYGDIYVSNTQNPVTQTQPITKVEVGPTWNQTIDNVAISPPVGLQININ